MPRRIGTPDASATIVRAHVLAALALVSCIHRRDRVEPDAPPPPPPPAPAAAEAIDTSDGAGPARIEIRALSGMTASQAAQWLAPVQAALAPCRPATPGLVHVQIVSRPDGTVMDVVGDTTLSALTRGCILSALSLYDEELLERAVIEPPEIPASDDPLDDPPAVSSLITVSW